MVKFTVVRTGGGNFFTVVRTGGGNFCGCYSGVLD